MRSWVWSKTSSGSKALDLEFRGVGCTLRFLGPLWIGAVGPVQLEFYRWIKLTCLKFLLLDWNTWNHVTVSQLFVLDYVYVCKQILITL